MPSVKVVAAAQASLQRLYGSRVAVHYHDLDSPEVQAQWDAMIQHFHDQQLPPPVTLLNGEVLFVGNLQPLKLVAVVAEWMHQAGELIMDSAE